MKALFFRLPSLAVCLITVARAAADVPSTAVDPAPATVPTPTTTATAPAPVPKPVTEEMIRARLAEHIKAKAAAKAPAQAPAGAASAAPDATPSATAAAAASAPAPTTPADMAQSKTEPAAVLPKVEVRRTRVTPIEKEVFQQEKDIEREKKNTKSSDVDRALNGNGRSFSLFGGESTNQRETMAKERVSLMESERDIMEAIAHAKTKEEKDELRKELNEIKTMRRDLETSVR